MKKTNEERFYSKINKTSSCHLWVGATDTNGYGRFRYYYNAHDYIDTGAHRIALEWKLGRNIGEEFQALHICDIRNCVNPEHLYEGNQSDNLKDAYYRGRKIGKSGMLGKKHKPETIEIMKNKIVSENTKILMSISATLRTRKPYTHNKEKRNG